MRDLFKKKPVLTVTDMCGLPSNVTKLNGHKEYGPNCWNATMLFFHTDEIVRYVDDKEMVAWLKKYTVEDYFKFCATGSILAMYDDTHQTENCLIHSAVWVGPGVLWHKRGVAGAWEFVTERQIRAIYPETVRYEYLLFKDKL